MRIKVIKENSRIIIDNVLLKIIDYIKISNISKQISKLLICYNMMVYNFKHLIESYSQRPHVKGRMRSK